MIRQQAEKIVLSPRGVNQVPPEQQYTLRELDVPEYNSKPTFKNLLDNRRYVIEQGLERLRAFTECKLPYAVHKAFALQVFTASVLQGNGILSSCDLAASCTSFGSRSIRRWANDIFVDFFSTVSSLENVEDGSLELELESERGKHPKWLSLMADENFKKETKQYVLDNGYIKGMPNLTLQKFVSWIKESKSVDVCTSTASVWLHDMGFSYKQFSKGVYFDGHERDDVVESRKMYLELVESFRSRMWVSMSPCLNPVCCPIIRVFHDESAFYANSDQSFHWTDGSRQALKQKSLGQAVMVSDFIEEVGGFLQHQGNKVRLLLEHQSEGYFTNDMLVKQVDRAIDIFEIKYTDAQGLFIFDHAPSHMKRPEDALNAERMNVRNGGKQPFMKDTVWDGRVQRMITDEGVQKGMKTVLEERGIDTHGLNAEKMREMI